MSLPPSEEASDATRELQPSAAAAQGGSRAPSAISADLAAIFEMIGEGFVAYDGAFNYLYVNARAAAMLGRHDLVGKNYFVEYPDAHGTPFTRACKEALASGVPVHFEHYYAPWERWFENRIYPSADGLAVFFTEVTDRKRAEAATAASEARLALVFDTVADVLCLLTVEGESTFRFESVNPAFLAVTGLTNEKVIGRRLEEIVQASRHDFVLGKCREAIASRSTVRWEGISAYPSGTLYGELAVTPAFNAEGVCTHLIGSAHDVSAARRAADEARQQNLELERRVSERTVQLETALKELESFSYSVSHDLRAPLRAIGGFAEIIARRHRSSLPEEGQRYFDNIVFASERMSQLIDALLDYSRLGSRAARRDVLALSEVFATLAADLAPRLQQGGGRLAITPDMPRVLGDRTLVGQVFSNLLDNALTYHHPGAAPEVEVEAESCGPTVVVRVRDFGIGIPAEYHDKIFNIFQRLHGDDAYPGTGIGLATARKSVEMLGGRIWVESSPGVGSTFFVELPAA